MLFAQIVSVVTVRYFPMHVIPILFHFVQANSPLDTAVYLLPFVSRMSLNHHQSRGHGSNWLLYAVPHTGWNTLRRRWDLIYLHTRR